MQFFLRIVIAFSCAMLMMAPTTLAADMACNPLLDGTQECSCDSGACDMTECKYLCSCMAGNCKMSAECGQNGSQCSCTSGGCTFDGSVVASAVVSNGTAVVGGDLQMLCSPLTDGTQQCTCLQGGCDMTACTYRCSCPAGNCKMSAECSSLSSKCSCAGGNCDSKAANSRTTQAIFVILFFAVGFTMNTFWM